jgi:hypothetical protein
VNTSTAPLLHRSSQCHRRPLRNAKGGLKILPHDRLIYKITAEKTLVKTDDEMGAWITLESF